VRRRNLGHHTATCEVGQASLTSFLTPTASPGLGNAWRPREGSAAINVDASSRLLLPYQARRCSKESRGLMYTVEGVCAGITDRAKTNP
jgi:hypothetical protein